MSWAPPLNCSVMISQVTMANAAAMLLLGVATTVS